MEPLFAYQPELLTVTAIFAIVLGVCLPIFRAVAPTGRMAALLSVAISIGVVVLLGAMVRLIDWRERQRNRNAQDRNKKP